MLLCSPLIHATNNKTHESRSPKGSMMSANSGGSASNLASSQRFSGYLQQGRLGRLSYAQPGFQHDHLASSTNMILPATTQHIVSPIGAILSHSSLPIAATTIQSPLALDDSHNPIPTDHDPWQSNITYRPTHERQIEMASMIPFTSQDLTTPIVTSSWSPQDAIETAGWQDGTNNLNNYAVTSASEAGFVDWSAVDTTTSWQAAMPMTTIAPVSTTAMDGFTSAIDPTPTAPYRQDSFFAYKPQSNAELPIYADMEMSAEIPYPNVFPEVIQELSPRMHPAFETDVENCLGLQQTTNQAVPAVLEETLLSSTDKQIITAALAKAKAIHAHSHGGVTKTKIIPKGGRVGPLTVSQREKVEDMRAYGACWRCRKYKKPCNGPGICNTCQTSGFRVWPSALGCRRGDFDSFAFGMIPTHSEQIVGQIIITWDKPASWRRLAKLYRSELVLPPSTMQGDKFEALMYKVQKTQLTGPGVMELLQIACNLQRGLAKESRVLANTLKGLAHACEFYGCFVSTDEELVTLPGRFDMVNIFTQNRKALLTTLSSFLNSCLTGRMKDWLPTFLSANFIVYTFVMLSDAAVMVPPQFRDKLWNSIKAIILDFRGILYPMAQDLLSALGKGSKLLHMQCWTSVEKLSEDPSGQTTWERNSEGMKILDNDIAIFDGLRALQMWLDRFGSLMRGDAWYTSGVHTVDVLPVCSWERMFDFSPRG